MRSTKGGLRVVKGPQQLAVHALLQLWQAALPAWRSTALDRRPEWAPLPSATEASGDRGAVIRWGKGTRS